MSDATRAWPDTAEKLESEQRKLAALADLQDPWRPGPAAAGLAIGGVFATLGTGPPDRDAARGDPAWAAAVVLLGGRTVGAAVVRGAALAPYRPGLLALQVGRLLERAVRALDHPPDVLLVNATGRDHPRGAGLALHLGAVLDLPTIGVTDRPLVAAGPEPDRRRWSATPLRLDGELVGYLIRTRRRVHPVAFHAAWRTDPETARSLAAATVQRARTPEPLRRARRLARLRRAEDEGRVGR